MLRFIQYRGKTIFASKSALQRLLKKMKDHADFAKRLNERKDKDDPK
mgnify:CR=1 FL=1